MPCLRYSCGLHLNGHGIVVVLSDPPSVIRDCRILHDLAGGDRPEVDLRNWADARETPRPLARPGQMPGNLIGPVRDLPDPGPGLKSIVLASTPVVRIDVGCHDH